MKIFHPSGKIALAVAEAYQEDGVIARAGYDENQGWYTEVDEVAYSAYQGKLIEERDAVLAAFAEPFEGLITQGVSGVPTPDQTRLTIYLVDSECQRAQGFKVTKSLPGILGRVVRQMHFGFTCAHCGKQILAVLQWENVKPKGE